MSALNKACLIGNVGGEPEVRTLQSGKKVASFRLATSEQWKDKATGERKEITDWHNIVVFNEALISLVENYVKKGARLYVEGALKTRKWQDKNGVEKLVTEVVLQGMHSIIVLLSTSENKTKEVATNVKSPSYDHSADLSDDEIPF